MDSKPNDATLLARVVRGEASALGTLYDRHASGLLRFAQQIDRQEAEDLLQTTFLRVAQRADRFDGRSTSARSWLFGIMVHVTQERSRSLRRFGAALKNLASLPRGESAAPLDVRSDLEKALATLTPSKRAALWLMEVEGFTCDEVAAMMEVPVGTVWTRLHHARRQLRLMLRDEFPLEEEQSSSACGDPHAMDLPG